MPDEHHNDDWLPGLPGA